LSDRRFEIVSHFTMKVSSVFRWYIRKGRNHLEQDQGYRPNAMSAWSGKPWHILEIASNCEDMYCPWRATIHFTSSDGDAL
jgi:3-methyladenine DNA glycosylase AlkC